MNRERFLQYTDKLKSFGFTVYICKNRINNYCIFTNGKDIGYMQAADFNMDGVNFTTVHKRSGQYGTGFMIGLWSLPTPLDILTKEIALQAFAYAPNIKKYNCPYVEKYADMDDFKKDRRFLSYENNPL